MYRSNSCKRKANVWSQNLTITSISKVRAHPLGLFRRFLFRFKNNRTYRISIPKRTDFTIPKQNSWREKSWGHKSRYAILPQKDERKLPKEDDHRLFCLFRTNLYSVYSVNSTIRNLGITIQFIPQSKEHKYRQFRVFSLRNSPK